jgi:hypothetical protein
MRNMKAINAKIRHHSRDAGLVIPSLYIGELAPFKMGEEPSISYKLKILLPIYFVNPNNLCNHSNNTRQDDGTCLIVTTTQKRADY